MTSLLLFAACWLRNLSAALPTILIRGRAALIFAVMIVTALPLAMVLIRPDLPPTLPVSVFVTGISIIVASRIGVSYVWDYAVAADRAAQIAVEERRTLVARRTAGRTAAEDTRVLHDTVINTLAAIAAGAAARDPKAVRERCALDVVTMERLQDAVGIDDDTQGLRSVPPVVGIRVRHTGAPDGAVRIAERRLSPAQLTTLRRCTAELLQNSAKHSGADDVEVHIDLAGDALVLTVADEGIGFDGNLREGRGLQRSVVQRAEEAGLAVHIDTAPGAGTRVRLTAPFAPLRLPEADSPPDSTATVRAMVRRAGLLFVAAMCVIGIVLAVANHPGEATSEYLMVLIVGSTATVTWWTTRRGAQAPRWAAGMLIVAAPVAFVFSAVAVDLGRVEPILWQAIAPTGPLLLLLMMFRRTAAVSGAIGYVVGILLTAAVAYRQSPEASAIVAVAGLVGLALVAGWHSFMRMIREIASASLADQQAAADARIEVAARDAADRARGRWRRAGLAAVLDLLRAIADGRADPSDGEIQHACADEEAHLRQLILLNPELIHLGPWLVESLSVARAQGISLVLRAGETDVDADSAEAWGSLLLTAIRRAKHGDRVTASVFPGPSGTRLLLVAPTDSLAPTLGPPESALFAVQPAGDDVLVERLVAS